MIVFKPCIVTLIMMDFNMIGFSKSRHIDETKYLILHGDDVGVSHGTNRASISLLRKGLITSVSVMAPCPWVYEASALLKECSGCDVGVHITLNSEWQGYKWASVSTRSEVPGLVDGFGNLFSTPAEILKKARDKEVEKEIEAQIIKAKRLGLKISHIDTHMGTVIMKRNWLALYVKMAERHDALPMLVKWSDEIEGYFKDRRIPFQGHKEFLLDKEKSGYPMLDRLIMDVGGLLSYEDRRAAYKKAIRSIKPGITQIITHLARPDDELKAMTVGRAHEIRRGWDLKILADPEIAALIKAENIVLISWSTLKNRRL